MNYVAKFLCCDQSLDKLVRDFELNMRTKDATAKHPVPRQPSKLGNKQSMNHHSCHCISYHHLEVPKNKTLARHSQVVQHLLLN